MKVCSICDKKKSNNDFYKTEKEENGFGTYCKSCIKIRKTATQVSKAEAERWFLEQEHQGHLYECGSCKEMKTASNFYFKRDYGKVYMNTTKCRSCTTIRHRFKSFGVTQEDFEGMLEGQDGKCALCLISMDDYSKISQNNRVFSVDHCHSTGKIRGLLCDKCNRGLGFFKDDIEALKRAIEYLKQ